MPSLKIAQITDIHLLENREEYHWGVKPYLTYLAVLEQVKRLNPDLLILTGDLAQNADSSAYIDLKNSLIPLEIPTYWIPGNHDSYELMAKHLVGGSIYPDKHVRAGAWQLLLLNSVLPNHVHGYLSAESLAWLDQKLAETPDCHTLIALHHPAVSLNSTWVDGMGLQNQSEFWQICDRYSQIRVIISGHAHQEFDTVRQNQIRYLVTPSTCVQFVPKISEIKIDQKSPAFRLLSLYPDGTLETEVIDTILNS